MTQTLAAPPPAASLRRLVARMWADPDGRSTLIGVLAVLLVHLFLFATAPYLLRTEPIHFRPRTQNSLQQFNIEIAPDAFVKVPPKPPPPSRYVEANPNAPDNAPDKTNNFSSQNQQLAQEKPQADQNNDKPKTEGRKNFQANQVVSGQLSKPQELVPVVPEAVRKPEKPEAAPRRAQNPLAGFEKTAPGEEGYATNLGKVTDVTKPAPEKVEGTNDAPLVENARTSEPAIDPKHPRARPVLQQVHTRPAIFEDNQFGTHNIGPIAYNAKWSNYGAYLHKMLEAIQVQWERILIESATYPPSGSTVTVKFTLDSKGRITEILDVESTSTEQGSASCVSAITNTAPYGDWTDDMIAVLGNSQELTIMFFYE